MQHKKKIAVAMSGGVDSTSVALLLQEKGYDIFGVTMYLFDVPKDDGGMGPPDFLDQAAEIASELGIDHHVIDLREVFRDEIQTYFARAYLQGRTPNPCVRCNRKIKYGLLLKEAERLGADFMATGHYANVVYDAELDCCRVFQGKADRKDQAYVLHCLKQDQLEKIMLPLGTVLDKERVREKVRAWWPELGDKLDSFGVCFIPNGDHGAFIESFEGVTVTSGNFIDQTGRILGRHRGIVHYTIGQKRKLGIELDQPMTVLEIRPDTNEIVLGPDCDAYARGLIAGDVNFIPFHTLSQIIRVEAKVCVWGYRLPATLVPMRDGHVRVQFDEPVRAIAPGQSVVFYMKNEIIGGGEILFVSK